MKKIGILTFHCADNYGAVLQCYAMQEFLQNNIDADVEVINYCPESIVGSYKFFDTYYKHTMKHNLVLWVKLTLAYVKNFSSKVKKINHFKLFRNNLLNLSHRLETKKEVEEYISDFDQVILGSDQIWNPELNGGYDDVYFGRLNDPHVRFISYAASVGINIASCELQEELICRCRGLEKIGVREQNIYDILKQRYDNLQINLDPVFLLRKDQWLERVENNKETGINGEYIFYYAMEYSEHMNSIVRDIKKKTNLKVIELKVGKTCPCADVIVNSVYPLEFVHLIANARLIITNSFHAAAFSVIMEKDFYVYPHTKRSSRLVQLLNVFGLQERMINENIPQIERIDYLDKGVTGIMERERERSREFLNV